MTVDRITLGVSENLTASIKVFKDSKFGSDAILVLTGTRRPEKGVEETFAVSLQRDANGNLMVPEVLITKLSPESTTHPGYTHYPFTGLYRVSAEAKVALVKKGDPFNRKAADGSEELVVEHNFRFEDSITLIEATLELNPADLTPVKTIKDVDTSLSTIGAEEAAAGTRIHTGHMFVPPMTQPNIKIADPDVFMAGGILGYEIRSAPEDTEDKRKTEEDRKVIIGTVVFFLIVIVLGCIFGK